MFPAFVIEDSCQVSLFKLGTFMVPHVVQYLCAESLIKTSPEIFCVVLLDSPQQLGLSFPRESEG